MSSDVLTGAEFERPVVVVEDNPRVRSFLERVVATRFHPISCATFGEAMQALDELSAPPLAMIVDVNLGTTYGNGLDIAAHARRRFGGAVPVLVLTAALDWEISERVNELRIELLVKPQASDAVRRFLDRAETRHDWRTADVIDLARALAEFARDHGLTDRQSTFLTAMMQAAERGEPMAINANTRKAGMRRLLSKTGHATFDAIRLDIKRRATQLS